MGLRPKEQKGPRRAPHPWSQRAGDLTWEPSRLPGFKWVGKTLFSPLLLLLEGPSRLPLLIPTWPPSYALKDPVSLEGPWRAGGLVWELSRLLVPEWVGQSPSAPLLLLWQDPSRLPLLISLFSLLCPQDPHSLDGALEGRTSLGAQQAPWPKWARRLPSAPLLLFPESPSHLPLLISWPQGRRSCLASTSPPSSVPLHPTSSLWGSSCLLGGQSPPPAASRCPSCGEALTPRLPTLPS